MVSVVVVLAWVLLSACVALVLGSSIRMADGRAPYTDQLVGLPDQLTVDDILAARTATPSV